MVVLDSGDVYSWGSGLHGCSAAAPLTLRGRPRVLLIQRPAAWAFVAATLCMGVIHAVAFPTFGEVLDELIESAGFVLLLERKILPSFVT